MTYLVFFRDSELISASYTSGTFVLQAIGVDLDEPGTVNSEIRYEIVNTVPFAIDAINGSITVNDDLTPENVTIEVEVYDLGTPSNRGNGSFLIRVAPRNDFDPVFQELPYTPTAPENSVPVDPVLSISVTDDDTGDEGSPILIGLEGTDSEFFYLNGSDLYLNASFDRETRDTYYFSVVARDDGEPEFYRTSTSNITFTVEDVNDNTPYFIADILMERYYVQEDAQRGDVVVTIQADDSDIGVNGEIQFSLSPESVDFELDSVSGNLTVNNTLRRSRQDEYTFNVTIADAAGLMSNDTLMITILIVEVNDHSPVFTEEFNNIISDIVIEENGPANEEISTIYVEDLDTGASGDVVLSLNDSSGRFSIINGTLFVIQPLDYENTSVHVISITAQDGGIPPLATSINITINVDDVNEFTPEFDADTYQGETIYTAVIGTRLFQASATDGDGADNVITYGLSASDDILNFLEIDPNSGVIRTRDAVPEMANVTTYTFNITATDNGRPNNRTQYIEARVVVYSPENEFPPEFDQRTYMASVDEGLPIGTSVLEFTITDDDGRVTPAGQISNITLNGVEADFFSISSIRETPNGYVATLLTKYVLLDMQVLQTTSNLP